MKRFKFISALALSFVLVACGGNESKQEEPNNEQSKQQVEAPEAEPRKVNH